MQPELFRFSCCLALLLAITASANADIGKVYHPYVEPLEREVELELVHSYDNVDQHETTYQLGYGQAVHEKIFLELSTTLAKNDRESPETEAWELESLIQLSEQGAGWMDYGVLLEVERETEENITEVGASLLLEKELGDNSVTANLGLAYEFGGGIDNEYDRFAKLQWRYRWQPALEPALEVHLDEYDKAAGPVILGAIKLPQRQKIKWELGWLFALDEDTPSSLLKAAIEYEF